MPEVSSQKLCSKCKEIKPISSFSPRSNRPGGFHSACKRCSLAYWRVWRRTEHGKAYMRHYMNQYPKERGRRARNEGKRRYEQRNKEKMAARYAFQNAVRAGKIKRPEACSQCGSGGKIEGHHHNGYSLEHRFDVIWLCRACHGKK